MKIAVVTDDGKQVAQHFGRARYYQVFTITDGAVVSRELRDRMGTLHHGHDHGHDHGHHQHDSAGGHGFHQHAPDRHAGMVSQIRDVEIILAGGMGYGARQALDEAGIGVIATQIRETDGAIQAWIDGTLTHEEERLH